MEILKPIISAHEPLDSVIERLACYGDALIKEQKRLIDRSLDCRKPSDGPKYLTNTGHDKDLKRQKTIHDKLIANPALLAELIADFGPRRK